MRLTRWKGVYLFIIFLNSSFSLSLHDSLYALYLNNEGYYLSNMSDVLSSISLINVSWDYDTSDSISSACFTFCNTDDHFFFGINFMRFPMNGHGRTAMLQPDMIWLSDSYNFFLSSGLSYGREDECILASSITWFRNCSLISSFHPYYPEENYLSFLHHFQLCLHNFTSSNLIVREVFNFTANSIHYL